MDINTTSTKATTHHCYKGVPPDSIDFIDTEPDSSDYGILELADSGQVKVSYLSYYQSSFESTKVSQPNNCTEKRIPRTNTDLEEMMLTLKGNNENEQA